MNVVSLWRRLRTHFDWMLLGLTAAIVVLGLVNLYSTTRHSGNRALFFSQIMWIAAGCGAFFVVSLLDVRHWMRIAWLSLLVGVVVIAVVHFFGISINGSRRWLGSGSYRVQPSEFLKIAVILALARFVHERNSDALPSGAVAVRVVVFFAALAFVYWQPDLGTAVLLAMICGLVGIMAWRELWPLCASLGGIGALGLGLLLSPWGKYFMHDYQRKRLLPFLDAAGDPSGAGWQTRQSIFAIGSGRLFGKGFLQGTQNRLNFLPEQQTDFPFSVWAEEWGFAGGALLLGLYMLLVLWTLHVASQARDRFSRTICLGVAAMLFLQVVVNIGMVTGMAPVVGITLPLFSRGGSSALTMLMALGLVASVSMRRFAR